MASQMQIGQEAQRTERAHLERYSVSGLQQFLKKQRSMALSSAEAEYMVASLAACEAVWMRKILVGLFGSDIDIRYHHIRDCV